MLQQQRHDIRVALLCCLVQGSVAQLRETTEGVAVSSGFCCPRNARPRLHMMLHA